MLRLTLLVLAGAVLCSGYPYHASCCVKWKFPSLTCEAVQGKLLAQIKAWTGHKNCKKGGEKCNYELKSNSSTDVTATHTTPKHGFVDFLHMKFIPFKKEIFFPEYYASPDQHITFVKALGAPSTGCKVHGCSRSEVWYAHLDFGTNYCNLHNLMTGSGLSNSTGFAEMTSDRICTQYSSANCDKY
ncbi:uncharacterized protein LOC143457102 [Clavelina lepadiformis]|uniref:uncharacterized protein LOC143457102 n=1 Tax=Clavelina lepadiformis TaxID=159417 RepID=UPI0040418A1C